MLFFFFFKQKTAYEMRISDWSSDVCSSDLNGQPETRCQDTLPQEHAGWCGRQPAKTPDQRPDLRGPGGLPEGRRPGRGPRRDPGAERKSVVWGTSVSVRVALGGRRTIKKKNDIILLHATLNSQAQT